MRPDGERRLRENYERVRSRFENEKGKPWRNWYGYRKSFRDLAREIGWEHEYRLWYRGFSTWVHSDPSRARHGPGLYLGGGVLMNFCYHYYARILLRIADAGRMILTGDQYAALREQAKDFT